MLRGHVPVVPKNESDKLFDLPENYLSEILVFAKSIATAIEKSFDCKRCGITVIGLEVPHAHIHLVPMNRMSDMNFSNPKLKLTPEELSDIAANIRKEF